MVTILEAAAKSCLTKQRVRYWLDLLEIEITKKEGKFYLPAGAVDLLIAMQKAISGGLSPALAAVEVKAIHALPVEAAPICNQDDHTADKIADLEKAVLLLAEQNKILADQNKMLFDQNKVILSMVQAQGNKMDFIAAKLLPSPASNPVKVWEPTTRQTQPLPFFKRLWLELIAPEQLRATP